ncbi:MAG: hypothetical protein ABIO44_03650 [Saprospiraceae bacterium]
MKHLYIIFFLLCTLACTPVTNRSKKYSAKTSEKSKTDTLANYIDRSTNSKENSGYVMEKEERLPFQNYNLYKDSVRVVDGCTLKFSNNKFLYQTNQKYDESKRRKGIRQIVEWRPGVVTIEEYANTEGQGPEFTEIRFYNKNRKCINKWNMKANDPWKKELGKTLNLDTTYEELGMSNLQANSKSPIPPSEFTSGYYYEVYDNTGNAVLYYFLSGLDDDKRLLYKSTYIIVLDSLGKELYRYKDDKKLVNHAILTQDQKYLLINGGGIVGEGLQRYEASYLKIIDTKSNKVIYSEKKEDLAEVYREFFTSTSTPHLVLVEISSYNKNYCVISYVYNLLTLQRCEKFYSKADCERIDIEKIPFTPNNRLHAFNYTCTKIKN